MVAKTQHETMERINNYNEWKDGKIHINCSLGWVGRHLARLVFIKTHM